MKTHQERILRKTRDLTQKGKHFGSKGAISFAKRNLFSEPFTRDTTKKDNLNSLICLAETHSVAVNYAQTKIKEVVLSKPYWFVISLVLLFRAWKYAKKSLDLGQRLGYELSGRDHVVIQYIARQCAIFFYEILRNHSQMERFNQIARVSINAALHSPDCSNLTQAELHGALAELAIDQGERTSQACIAWSLAKSISANDSTVSDACGKNKLECIYRQLAGLLRFMDEPFSAGLKVAYSDMKEDLSPLV